jgi:hypothetical protein
MHSHLQRSLLPINRGRRRRDVMVVVLTITYGSVPITADVVASNHDQGEVYNIM